MAAKNQKFVRPFRMGDVVTIKSTDGTTCDSGEHVVNEAQFEGDNFSYSTHRSAWHAHDNCTLVRECDEESLATLKQALNDEEGW